MAPGSRSTGRKKYVSDLQVYRAGERNRTADLPLTRRMLCLLSYTGWLAIPSDGSPLS